MVQQTIVWNGAILQGTVSTLPIDLLGCLTMMFSV